MKHVIVIMGVSGSGKTTIGRALSNTLNIPFFDADDFHPKANIKKMENNISLSDSDRIPWLLNLSTQIEKWQSSTSAVLACSALKESYRQILNASKNKIFWVVLNGSFDVIEKRMKARKNHYMKPSLLQSQFEILEIPKYGFHVNIEHDVNEITDGIIKAMSYE
ncbi:gluconokinase [Flavobacteriaceae bacterium MHTCC 0001]